VSPQELVHRVREPAGDPEGALVLMHGRATDENDLFPILDFLDPDKRLLGIAPGGPLTDQPPGGRHWYAVKEIGYPEPRTFAEGYAALTGFLDSILEERGIDWSKTVAGGFSQGAVMSYAIGLGASRPRRPAGILAMSGFVPTVEGWQPDLESRKGLPVLISHGELDPVIPVEFGRRARDLLTEAGLDVTYHESRMAHSIDPRVVPEIADWVVRVTGSE
jgi:phospholipase/carboxylesterase